MAKSMREKMRDKPHYSISQLGAYAGCPRAYYYRYIKKIRSYPLYVLASGKSIHAGLEENNNEIIAGHRPLTPKQIVEKAVDVFELTENIAEMDVDVAEGKDKLVKDIKTTTEDYVESIQPQLMEQIIVSSENSFDEKVAGKKFIGFTDVTTKEMVFDYKLVGRRKSANEVNLDPQLVMYEKFTKLKGGFILLLRGKGKTEISIPSRSPRVTKAIEGWCDDTVRQIEKAKKHDVFPMIRPTEWRCGTCSFKFECFKRRS
jgi:CRISPR/Cas system-associated exonuclease Cas4 (RecB family)